MFFKKTLRLQGPAGRSQLLALRNTILPVGGGPDGQSLILVEQGDVVALNIWGPNHDKDICEYCLVLNLFTACVIFS